MIIACPRCGASYAVEARAFGLQPRTVECSACGERWQQQPPDRSGRRTGAQTGAPGAARPAAAPAPAGREEDEADGGASGPSPAQPGAAADTESVWPFDAE